MVLKNALINTLSRRFLQLSIFLLTGVYKFTHIIYLFFRTFPYLNFLDYYGLLSRMVIKNSGDNKNSLRIKFFKDVLY